MILSTIPESLDEAPINSIDKGIVLIETKTGPGRIRTLVIAAVRSRVGQPQSASPELLSELRLGLDPNGLGSEVVHPASTAGQGVVDD